MNGLIRLLLLPLLHAGSASGLCFSDGIPSHLRQDSDVILTDQDAAKRNGCPVYNVGDAQYDAADPDKRQPCAAKFGMWLNEWESSLLFSSLFKILVEERLGYNVTYSHAASSGTAWAIVSGCSDPTDIPATCNKDKFNPYMVSNELWYRSSTSWVDRGHPTSSIGDDGLPSGVLFLGDTGYFGREGMAFSNYTQQQTASTCPMEFYKMLQSAQSPWANFEHISTLDETKIRPCNETQLTTDTTRIKHYLAMDSTPDYDGTTTDSAGDKIGKCWDKTGANQTGGTGYLWLAPACRNDINKCVPLLTQGDGWGLYQYIQLAKQYNMPFALGVAKSGKFDDLVGEPRRNVFYTYTTYSQKFGQTMVLFPPYNSREWTQLNLFITDGENAKLDKAAWVHLPTYFPRIVTLGQRLQISYDTMLALLRDWESDAMPKITVPEQVAKGEHLACEWLKNNANEWADYVPEQYHCASTQGVVTGSGSFTTNLTVAQMCQKCPKGRHSTKVAVPGKTFVNYVCTACNEGYEQPYEGHTGLCTRCNRGRYAATKGNSECTNCPRGKYMDVIGQSACSYCGEGKFAPELGTATCEECPKGTFRTADESANTNIDVKNGADCNRCPLAEYQHLRGQTECVHCDAGYRTPAVGSQDASQCQCPEGWYSNFLNNNVCEKCPKGADEDVEPGLRCPGGYQQQLNPANNTYDQTVIIKDGFMSMPESPLNVYKCDPKKKCEKDRSPFPGAGAPMCTLHGVIYPGCSRCDSGDFFNGETCKKCSDLFFPAWAIALVIWLTVVWAGYGLYYSSMFPPSPVSGCYGPVIGLLQCVSLTLDQSVPLSKDVRDFISVFAVMRVDLSVFAFPKECVFSNNPAPLYLERVIWPILLALAFFAVWGLINSFSTLVCKILKKDIASPIDLFSTTGCIRKRFDNANEASKKTISAIPLTTRVKWFWNCNIDDVANVLNKTAHSLFISLANCGLFVYITVNQPGGDTTLKLMPNVEFMESTWWSMFPISLFGILVYNCGYFAYVIRTVYISPRYSPTNFRFCKRNRGLWAKYDPESWWFCIPAVIFSLFINLTSLVQNGRIQVLMGVCFTALYIGVVSTFKPYKFMLNHKADLVCKFGYMVVLLSNSLVVIEEPLDPKHIGYIVILASCAPVAICLFIGLKYIWFQRVAKRHSLQSRVEFAYRFQDTVNIVGHWKVEDLRHMCFNLLDNDLAVLEDALDLLSYKLLGYQPYKAMKLYNFMPNPAAPGVTKPFKLLSPGVLEGICETRGLNAGGRKLIRELREKIITKQSVGAMPESPGGAEEARTTGVFGAKASVKNQGLLFMGLPNADKVAKCMNHIFLGNVDGDLDVSRSEFGERMKKLLGVECYDEPTLDKLFRNLDLQGAAPGVESTVDQYELAVQLSVSDPVLPVLGSEEEKRYLDKISPGTHLMGERNSTVVQAADQVARPPLDDVKIEVDGRTDEGKPIWPKVDDKMTCM